MIHLTSPHWQSIKTNAIKGIAPKTPVNIIVWDRIVLPAVAPIRPAQFCHVDQADP